MVLHELDAGVVVGRVKLVRDVPAERPELTPLLHRGVQEGDGEEHGFPLRHVGHVQEVLRRRREGAHQTGAHALWGFVCELDGHLEGEIS